MKSINLSEELGTTLSTGKFKTRMDLKTSLFRFRELLVAENSCSLVKVVSLFLGLDVYALRRNNRTEQSFFTTFSASFVGTEWTKS